MHGGDVGRHRVGVEPGVRQALGELAMRGDVDAPHTAFDDPFSPPDALERESIETRALVIY